jgi:tetratricopeptide (TPR) repeat protein
VAAVTVVTPAPVEAHGATDEQILALTLRIRDNPRNAELFLRRGDLYSEHENWDSALDDYQHAARLDPALATVDLARGRTLFSAGQFDAARTALDRFVVREPLHPEARILRARVLAQLSQLDASVHDYTLAIDYLARLGAPNPDYYLERAQASASRGLKHIPDALGGLEEGMATLGPLAVLQLYAIELELKLERVDAALARLESLVAQTNRRESLLARLGEILELAGRTEAARAAYEQAVSAIHALPPRHRTTRATVELEAHLRDVVVRLQRSAN